ALGCTALALLVLEVVLPKSQHRYIPAAAMLALAAVFTTLVLGFHPDVETVSTFGGMLRHSSFGQVSRLFFCLSALGVCFLSAVYLPRVRVPRVEFYHTILVVTAAMMLLAQSDHFVMFFVALETVTIGFYI